MFFSSTNRGTCTCTDPPQDVSRAEIYANAEFQYDLTLPGGAVLRAWTYTRGNLTVNLLFDPDCISVLTTVSFNGVPHMIDLLEDVQIGKRFSFSFLVSFIERKGFCYNTLSFVIILFFCLF